MEDPNNSGARTMSGTGALAETLEELSDPLDLPEAGGIPLSPGTTLTSEDEEPFTVIRLLKDGSPLRLYEARQDDDEETVWLWERTGDSASLLAGEGSLLRELRCPMFPRVQANFTFDGRLTSQLRAAPGKHSLSNFVQESSILRGQSQSSLRLHLPLPSCTRRVSFIWDFAQE